MANAGAQLEARFGDPGEILINETELVPLPCSDRFALPHPLVPCSNRCGVLYCSEKCKNSAWKRSHSLVCSGGRPRQAPPSSVSPMRDFLDFAATAKDLFSLGAQATATILLTAREYLRTDYGIQDISQPISPSNAAWKCLLRAFSPFNIGEKEAWWEVGPISPSMPPEQLPEQRQQMKTVAENAHDLLVRALRDRDPDLCDVFPAILDRRVWAALLGVLERHGLLMIVASPVPSWAATVQRERKTDDASLSSYSSFELMGGLDSIVDNDDEWLCVGNAFYPLQACMAHSCAPNAHPCKIDGRDRNGDGTFVFLFLHSCAPFPTNQPHTHSHTSFTTLFLH